MKPPSATSYYVDEAGDGVLFGPRGRLRLEDPDASRYFMLGMVACADAELIAQCLSALRRELSANPLYSSIPSMLPDAQKTARVFHAKDDHPEVRARVFERILTCDFKFFAVIKDMRAVHRYVLSRNQMSADYRYHPNELYDLAVRLLFEQRLHKQEGYRVVFARRGKSDRTAALKEQLMKARQRFSDREEGGMDPRLEIVPMHPWEESCLQVADYCLWALQRCYERHEPRFLQAVWPKVSLIRDVDRPGGKAYGAYHTRNGPLPDVQEIKSRGI